MVTKTIVSRSGTKIVNLTAQEEETRKKEQEAWLAANPPKTEFQISMQNLRIKRNDKLAETDFHGMSDRTMSAEMATYRQELRDLTNGLTTVEDVEAVVFPTKP